uniref:2Fe-2S ferredoxin-type domain-containing protein n=1 Tax=Oryza punctata TaxID=4537 RepID=A0A0E0L8Y0_ORYPU
MGRLHPRGSASATAATLSTLSSSSSSSHFAAVVEGRRAAAPATGHRKWCRVVGCGEPAMLSRISQLGARILRENRAAGKLPSRTTSYYQGRLSRHLAPAKNTLFSTASTSSDHHDGSQDKEKISVTFVNKDGTEQTISVPVGMSMLEAAHENDIELEGACEGSLACSTCHVIVMDVNYYNKLEDPTDEENDMLDLAFGLTETSRLGCQVIAKPELDGMRLALPAATRNFAVDGFVPKPH